MANSDWASEAFPPDAARNRDRNEDRKHGVFADPAEAALVLFEQDQQVENLLDELELTDGCEACFAWVFGSGVQCELHNYER